MKLLQHIMRIRGYTVPSVYQFFASCTFSSMVSSRPLYCCTNAARSLNSLGLSIISYSRSSGIRHTIGVLQLRILQIRIHNRCRQHLNNVLGTIQFWRYCPGFPVTGTSHTAGNTDLLTFPGTERAQLPLQRLSILIYQSTGCCYFAFCFCTLFFLRNLDNPDILSFLPLHIIRISVFALSIPIHC